MYLLSISLYCFLNSFFSFFFSRFFSPPLFNFSFTFSCWALPFHQSLLLTPFSLSFLILPVAILFLFFTRCLFSLPPVQMSFPYADCLPSSFIYPGTALIWEFRAIQGSGNSDRLYSSCFCDYGTREIWLIFFPKLALSFSCIASVFWLPFIYFLS